MTVKELHKKLGTMLEQYGDRPVVFDVDAYRSTSRITMVEVDVVSPDDIQLPVTVYSVFSDPQGLREVAEIVELS